MNPIVRSAVRPSGVLRTKPSGVWSRPLSSTPETNPASAPQETPTQPEPTTAALPTPTPPPTAASPKPPARPENAQRWEAERAQLVALVHKTRLEAERRWTSWLSTAQQTARERYHQLELDKKLKEAGARINEATGYEEIDRLRLRVGTHEKELLELRTAAADAKASFNEAMKLRTESQREVNDLLQRKSHWSSQDVLRFTELVQQDHENERTEQRAKAAMEAADIHVDRAFSDLMQAILERYHEEQVWSDKIRSLSTYGSLGITSLNVLLFIITLLLIEPWKRKRLVEGVEQRLRTSTTESHEATQASLLSLQHLLTDAQAKIDQLLPLATQAAQAAHAPPALVPADLFVPQNEDEPHGVQGLDTAGLDPAELHEAAGLAAAAPGQEAEVEAPAPARGYGWLDRFDLSEKDRELVVVGAVGALAGMGMSALVALLGR